MINRLLEKIFSLLKLNIEINFTTSYEKNPSGVADMRHKFHPDIQEEMEPYRQVFAERHGFINDLSIIDKLFNQGV